MARETFLMGRGREVKRVSASGWRHYISSERERTKAAHPAVTADQLAVRNYMVRALLEAGEPIRVATVGEGLSMPTKRVERLVAALERELVFLVRDAAGAITWAYPLTVEQTPHRVTLSTGEQFYAACASGVLEAIYLLGILLEGHVQARCETSCVHCGRPLVIHSDAALNVAVESEGAEPLVFEPRVSFDPASLAGSSLIDAY